MAIDQGKRTHLATVAILGTVLIAGVLLGMVLDRRLLAQTPGAEPAAVVAGAPGPGEGEGGSRERRRMSYYLVQPPLDSAQLARADQIMARRRAAARAAFEDPRVDSLYRAMKAAEHEFEAVWDPRFRALVDSSRMAIKQLMTPEQATNYDSILAESDRKRRGGN